MVLNENHTRQIVVLLLDYFKYTQIIFMILSLFMTASLLFISVSDVILPFSFPYFFKLASFFGVKNFESDFTLERGDMLKIWGLLSLGLFLVGNIVGRFTKFRIVLSFRRKLFYVISFIIGSYIISGISIISQVEESNVKESYLVLIFFTVLTIIFSIYGMIVSYFVNKIKDGILYSRKTAEKL